jgi:hypothetical protein
MDSLTIRLIQRVVKLILQTPRTRLRSTVYLGYFVINTAVSSLESLFLKGEMCVIKDKERIC